MIRNLKALGLALVAILAMAVFASSASAESPGIFTAKTYPAHIYAEDTDDTFTVAGNIIQCTHGTFTGVAEKASTKITIEPEYTNCTKNGTEPATVTMNKCAYVFEVGTMTGHTEAHGSVEIECPVGKVIEVHSYTNHAAHTGNSPNCTVTIGPQTVGNVTYTNNLATTDVFVESTDKEGIIVAAQTHGACSFGLTINTTGDYDAGVTVTATESNPIHVATAG
jgi:hypothetical protein